MYMASYFLGRMEKYNLTPIPSGGNSYNNRCGAELQNMLIYLVAFDTGLASESFLAHSSVRGQSAPAGVGGAHITPPKHQRPEGKDALPPDVAPCYSAASAFTGWPFCVGWAKRPIISRGTICQNFARVASQSARSCSAWRLWVSWMCSSIRERNFSSQKGISMRWCSTDSGLILRAELPSSS